MKDTDLTNREIIQEVWKFLRIYKISLFVSLTLLILSVPLTNFHPLVWGWVADGLIESSLSQESLFYWLILMSATYFIGILLHAIHSYLLERSGQAFIRDIRSNIFRKFEAQSLNYHKNSSTGELVARITSDVDAMEQSVLQGFTSLLEEVVTFIIVAAMVLWISPLVGSLSILPLAFAFIFIKYYNKRVKTVYEAVRKQLGNIGSFVQDRLAGITITQIFTQETLEQKAFDKKADQFYQSSIQASRMRNILMPLISSFGFINNLIMLGVGGWLILNGDTHFTIGALLAYRGFWWRLQSPIRTIAQTSDIAQRARAAAKRVMTLLREPIEIMGPEENENSSIVGKITFQNVHFNYPEGEPVLKDVSFTIHPNEFVAIAGSSGSGKSTLIHLITRFYDCTSGEILVDDTPIKSFALKSLRTPMGLVGQENYLFDGTIDENIRYAKQEIDAQKIYLATQSSNADSFIKNMPKAYDTHVGQNGLKLSGGQRQRISLARTFITNPTILLLDEPTASVEPESENVIYETILNRAKKKLGTTLLVTHRIDLLKQAPRILFFDKGKLAGDNTHQNLIRNLDVYKEAYDQWKKE
jgi:ABC-type multidrug transport system fused ATPase/permease subunit